MQIKIVVLNGHSLGYILPELPNDLQVLHSLVLKGSPYPTEVFTIPISSIDNLELATSTDFETFRVCEKGYKNSSEYEYKRIAIK